MDSILDRRLKTLMAARLVMVTTLLLVAVYVETVTDYLPINPLYFLIGATYGLTVLHALALRLIANPVPLVYAQVVGDLFVISGLVYVTGGTRAGFILLYPISVLTGSVLLFRRGGLVLAALATTLYAGMLWLVRIGWIAPQGLSDVPLLAPKAIFYSVFVTGVACATVAMIGSYFSESLHSAAEQLEEAVEQVADLRKLNEVIVDSIHSGLLTADGAGRILYVNGFGEAILGRRAAEMRGRTIREVFGSWLLDAPGLQARSELARLDVPYTRPDGGALDLGVSVSPLASGARGHLLVFQDLTEITRLEREIRMKEKLAAVGEMASQLAHEIRNPLGSISGSAQVLMAEPNISADQSRLLAIIRRESKRLSDSLSQFLFLTRPAPPPGGPFDLGPVVAEAVTLLRNGSEVRPGHVVDFEKDEGPHTCLAHPDRITQVFWNLVRNGLEAMPDGGRLAIRLSRRGDEVVLSVRDQGRGIAREDQRKVFEPFHSGTAMGTGLGLAIVYRIVREHRGDITIKSAPAQGTEVEVHLPLARALVSA